MKQVSFEGRNYRLVNQPVDSEDSCEGCAFFRNNDACGNFPSEACVGNIGMVWENVNKQFELDFDLLERELQAFGCDDEVKDGKVCDVWCGDRSSCIHTGY